MAFFILFMLFLVTIIPVTTTFIRLYRRVRQYRDMFRGFTDPGSPFSEKNDNRERTRGGWTYPVKRKKKVFDRNEGEYVDFKEIKITETATYSEFSDGTGRNCRYACEQRITDAEWEEIN